MVSDRSSIIDLVYCICINDENVPVFLVHIYIINPSGNRKNNNGFRSKNLHGSLPPHPPPIYFYCYKNKK